MEDWSRQRARQEREMAANACSIEARCAHLGLLTLHLRACPWHDAEDGSICPNCDLRPECERFLGRLPASPAIAA